MQRINILTNFLLDHLTPRSILYNISGPDVISTSIGEKLTSGKVFHINKNIESIKSTENITVTDTTDLELLQDYYVPNHPKPFIFLGQSCLLKPFIKGIGDSITPCKVFVECLYNRPFYKNVETLLKLNFKVDEILRNKTLSGNKCTKKYEYNKDKMYLYKSVENPLETLTRIDISLIQYILLTK